MQANLNFFDEVGHCLSTTLKHNSETLKIPKLSTQVHIGQQVTRYSQDTIEKTTQKTRSNKKIKN